MNSLAGDSPWVFSLTSDTSLNVTHMNIIIILIVCGIRGKNRFYKTRNFKNTNAIQDLIEIYLISLRSILLE